MITKGTRRNRPPPSQRRATRPLELVHMDIAGPFKTSTQGNKVYFLVIVDDYSRKAWVYLLSNKSQAPDAFEHFCNEVGGADKVTCVRAVRSDNAGEFIAGRNRKFCEANNIRQEIASAREQHQNGVAERWVRILKEATRVLLKSSNLPLSMWGWAITHAIEVKNEMPTASNPGRRSPNMMFYKRKAQVKMIRTFGCHAVLHLAKEDVSDGALGDRGIEGIF
eukprot:356491-Rhodomonas_salina.1